MRQLAHGEPSSRRLRGGSRRAGVLTAVALCLSLIPGSQARADHESFRVKPGPVELVSVNWNGEQQQGNETMSCTAEPSVSDDGRFVAFWSKAHNLHPADNNGPLSDVFVRDRKRGRTLLISKTLQGTSPQVPSDLSQIANETVECVMWSFRPAISGNGRYVVYTSLAPMTKVEHERPVKTLPLAKVFLYDMKKDTTELVSVAKNGDAPNAAAGVSGADVSNDGRFIVFESEATNLVDLPDCALDPDLPVTLPQTLHQCNQQTYLYDRETKKTTLVTKTPDGQLPNNAYTLVGQASTIPQISDDGRYVVFGSKANNLVDNDANVCVVQAPSCEDIFRYDVKRDSIELVSVARTGFTGDADSITGDPLVGPGQVISADGRFIVFWSTASDHVPAGGQGAFVRDMKTKRTERLSVFNYGGAGGGVRPDISDDGRYVSFIGNYCVHLQTTVIPAPGCPTAVGKLFSGEFFHDRHTGQTDVVQIYHDGEGGPQLQPQSSGWSISGSGRQAVWSQYDEGSPIAGDDNVMADVFLRDFQVETLGLGGLSSGVSGSTRTGESGNQVAGTSSGPEDDPLREAADIIEAKVVFRPQLQDAYVSIDVAKMSLVAGALDPMVYGLSFSLGPKSYEVRATGLNGGAFDLLDCTGSAGSCEVISKLQGGYGTTGERVVFSLPVREIGLQRGQELKDVSAFSGLRSLLTGTVKILDRVPLK